MAKNLGIYAGGVARGITQGIANATATDELNFKSQQRDRVTKDQTQQDNIDKQTADFMHQRLTVQPNPAGQGIATTDSSVKPVASASPPDSSQPGGPAGGISVGADASAPAAQDATPQFRAPTIDDMTAAAQYRANLYMQSGNFDKAKAATDDFLHFAKNQLDTQTAQRANAVKATVGKIMMGDFSTIPAVYGMIPDGNHIQNIAKNPDGTITMNVIDSAGKPMPVVTFKDVQHLANAVSSLADPAVALGYLKDQAKNKIEQEKADASMLKAKAAKTAADKTAGPAYKLQAGAVASVLGDPAVDSNGKPIMDIMSGKQAINRNVGKENAFYQWMKDNNITDTNEGLLKYMSRSPDAPAAPVKVPTKPLSAY